MPDSLATLQSFLDLGYHITLFCEACPHSQTLDKHALVERFGPDFNVIERRAQFLSRFKCTACGSKNVTLRIGSDHAGKSAMSRGEG